MLLRDYVICGRIVWNRKLVELSVETHLLQVALVVFPDWETVSIQSLKIVDFYYPASSSCENVLEEPPETADEMINKRLLIKPTKEITNYFVHT